MHARFDCRASKAVVVVLERANRGNDHVPSDAAKSGCESGGLYIQFGMFHAQALPGLFSPWFIAADYHHLHIANTHQTSGDSGSEIAVAADDKDPQHLPVTENNRKPSLTRGGAYHKFLL